MSDWDGPTGPGSMTNLNQGEWIARAEAAEARVAELEAALEEAEIEVSVAAHFEDMALATDRADELAELSERLHAALKEDDLDS